MNLLAGCACALKLSDPIGHRPVSWNQNFNPASYKSPISLA
jgi:hypothetical protein